jgi:EpsD family peptidyl-prolyl cis-trans isomerase
MFVTAAALALSACGGADKKDKPASQVAAKVNKEELSVHQINFLLQQQRGIPPEQVDAASRQILERLIDQELALQKASELRVDRDPAVMQKIDAARREIIARAYAEKIGAGVSPPTAAEIRQYYNDKPALFKDRRVYTFQEISIEARPEQVADLRDGLKAAKSMPEFVESLKANGFRVNSAQAVRAAEQLPLANLDAVAAMKDGETVFTPTPAGAQVVVLLSSRSLPVSEEQAGPAISQFLLNERKRKMIEDDAKALRLSAKIEYVGSFAQPAASAPISTPVAAPALPPAASEGLDAKSINGGMGLK